MTTDSVSSSHYGQRIEHLELATDSDAQVTLAATTDPIYALPPDPQDFVAFQDVSVYHILENKKVKDVVTASTDETVFEAIQKMAALKVGALVCVDKDRVPIGMISERDYMTKIILKGLSSKKTHVNDIMTKNIQTIGPSTTAAQCMKMMTEGRFRHIPVVDDAGKMVGIVSIGDLVKYVMDQQQETIRFLKQYIERTY